VEAICSGETNPAVLAAFRHGNCRKSEEEIAKALQSNKREDFLFALKQEFAHYQYMQRQIEECDEEIKKQLNDFINQDETKKALFTEAKIHKRINKNAPKNIDLNLIAYQYFDGIDLLAIQGVSHATVLTLMSEVGAEGLKKFGTAKQFASWLRLCPNKKVSGGKILSSRTPKGSNRLKIALRQAANAIGNLKDNHLSNFFNRVCFRKGRPAAISATARKLAIIIWNMIVKHQPFNPPDLYEYLDQKRKRKVRELQKQIAKLDDKLKDLKVPQNAVLTPL
uniref:transposase n=2 Tax=Nafulsella turpanensis TaxID=1265690 RepID=UPI00036DFC88